MKSGVSTLATILVVIVVAWLGLKLIGVAFKAVGLLIVIGVVVVLPARILAALPRPIASVGRWQANFDDARRGADHGLP